MKIFNYWPVNGRLRVVKSAFLTSLLVFPALSSASHLFVGAGVDCDFGSPILSFYDSVYSSSPGAMTGVCTDTRGPIITGSATARGGGGILRGRSRINYSDLSSTYTSGIFAQTNVSYYDTLTFNLAGLADNADAIVRATLTLNGYNSIRADDSRTTVGASASLRAGVNSSWGYTSVWESSDGSFNDQPTVTWDIPVRNGADAVLSMMMRTMAGISDGWQYGSGSAKSEFSNTGGITSFEYFALDGTPLTGSFTSVEGFTLYDPTVVPVPTAIWLFGSGLIGLVGIARRKKAA